LTKTLIPLLKKGENSRLINLSSAAQAPVTEEVLLGKKTETERNTYAQSKLALTMWSFDLAKKLMVREAFGQFWSSADKGGNILYDLAVSAEHEGITGKYFDNDQGGYGPAHTDAYKQAAIDKLMAVTEQLLT